jgi:hypothetical protein
MSKIGTLAVAAAAYVLGARAGRERYEQVRSGAQRVWSDPRVRTAADSAKGTVAGKAPQFKDRAADALKQTASKAKASTSRSQSAADDPTAYSPPVAAPPVGTPSAGSSGTGGPGATL